MNSERLDEKRRDNQERRLERVVEWAEYVRTHPDEEWSAEQNVLVEAMFDRSAERTD